MQPVRSRSGRDACCSSASRPRDYGGGEVPCGCPGSEPRDDHGADFPRDIRSAGGLTSTPISTKVASRKASGFDAASDSGFCEPCPDSSAATAADSPYVGEYSRRDACLSQSLSDDAVAIPSCELETSTGAAEARAQSARRADAARAAASAPRLDGSLSECFLGGEGDEGLVTASYVTVSAVLSPPFSIFSTARVTSDADRSGTRDVQGPTSVHIRDFSLKLRRFLNDSDPNTVIGRRVGLDRVDIVAELANMDIPCLAWIARHLALPDLQRCCMVSRSWLSVFQRHLPPAVKGTPSNKENAVGALKKSNHSSDGRGSPSKAPSLCRPCLATVQPTAESHQLTRVPAPAATNVVSCSSGLSLHQRFVEEAKNLLSGEKLSKCPHCHHPARLNEAAQRGMCTRVGCSFDYCTNCFCAYHGASACPPQPLKRTRHDTIGSQRSKRNLRRL